MQFSAKILENNRFLGVGAPSWENPGSATGHLSIVPVEPDPEVEPDLRVQDFLNFMQFFEKFGQNPIFPHTPPPEGQRHLLQGIQDPPLSCIVTSKPFQIISTDVFRFNLGRNDSDG